MQLRDTRLSLSLSLGWTLKFKVVKIIITEHRGYLPGFTSLPPNNHANKILHVLIYGEHFVLMEGWLTVEGCNNSCCWIKNGAHTDFSRLSTNNHYPCTIVKIASRIGRHCNSTLTRFPPSILFAKILSTFLSFSSPVLYFLRPQRVSSRLLKFL